MLLTNAGACLAHFLGHFDAYIYVVVLAEARYKAEIERLPAVVTEITAENLELKITCGERQQHACCPRAIQPWLCPRRLAAAAVLALPVFGQR